MEFYTCWNEKWNYLIVELHSDCLKVWSYWNQPKVWNFCFLLSMKKILTLGYKDYCWVMPFPPHPDCYSHPGEMSGIKWQDHAELLDVEHWGQGSRCLFPYLNYMLTTLKMEPTLLHHYLLLTFVNFLLQKNNIKLTRWWRSFEYTIRSISLIQMSLLTVDLYGHVSTDNHLIEHYFFFNLGIVVNSGEAIKLFLYVEIFPLDFTCEIRWVFAISKHTAHLSP